MKRRPSIRFVFGTVRTRAPAWRPSSSDVFVRIHSVTPRGRRRPFDAIALAPNGPSREDAEARRVEALEASGRHEQCMKAKAAFLAHYPGGIHRERVSSLCGAR
jgi:hypothetical protein